MVTELPTVTEEMLMGTVPLMDAVTEPICAVPAASAGKDAKDAGWVAWKNVPETGTVPEIDAVTLPICAVPAPMVTEPDTAGRELTVTVVDASETGCVA